MVNQLQTNYSFEGLQIQVVCAAPHIAWLNEFLQPWLNFTNLVMIKRIVILIEDDSQFLSLESNFLDQNKNKEDRVGFLLDASPVIFSAYQNANGKTWQSDPNFKAFYQINSDGIKIIVPTNYAETSFILARVIRELAIAKSLESGIPILHGAAVAKKGKGILILGDRGAGKTSFSAYCMIRLGYDFIANDRVVILENEQESIKVHGIPTLVRIRRPTSKLLPEVEWRRLSRPYSSRHTLLEAISLNKDYQGDAPEHIFLSPTQYPWLLQASIVSQMPLHLLLFPCLVPENKEKDDKLHFERLSTQETYLCLKNNSFSRWLPEEKQRAFCLTEKKPNITGIDGVLRRMSQEIPAYRCFLTPNVYQDQESLSRLLDTL